MRIQFAYIHSRLWDTLLILAPPLLVFIALRLMPVEWVNGSGISPLTWLILIVGVDVAHVYSTLFRSYLNPVMFYKHRTTMLAVPILSLAIFIILYTISSVLFWKALTYLAIFHFIRQQYGFVRLYSRKENTSDRGRTEDGFLIYSATLYPILYWHLAGDRHFIWFTENDFFSFSPSPTVMDIGFTVWALSLIWWIISMMITFYREALFNLPRNAIIAGTYLSWYIGIIYYNGDLAFTAMNVLCHGIPYMALVWFTKRKDEEKQPRSRSTLLSGLGFYIMLLLLLAFVEESLWDGLIWRDRPEFFSFFHGLPHLDSHEWQSLVVPILALPQITHYVLDGFIWKVSKGDLPN